MLCGSSTRMEDLLESLCMAITNSNQRQILILEYAGFVSKEEKKGNEKWKGKKTFLFKFLMNAVHSYLSNNMLCNPDHIHVIIYSLSFGVGNCKSTNIVSTKNVKERWPFWRTLREILTCTTDFNCLPVTGPWRSKARNWRSWAYWTQQSSFFAYLVGFQYFTF